MNVYAQSKVAADLVTAARGRGLTAAIGRFSSVYGDATDYPDRIVPAFATAAVRGGEIRIEGRNHTFDFTHVEDVAHGICTVVEQLASGERALPPVHFVSGIPTTLDALAAIAIAEARGKVTVVAAPPRSFDVSPFYGDPSRARELLGWTAQIGLRSGFSRLQRTSRQICLKGTQA